MKRSVDPGAPVSGVAVEVTERQMDELVRAASTDEAYGVAAQYARGELRALADLLYLDPDALPSRRNAAVLQIVTEARK